MPVQRRSARETFGRPEGSVFEAVLGRFFDGDPDAGCPKRSGPFRTASRPG
jgi:hypothetical protein